MSNAMKEEEVRKNSNRLLLTAYCIGDLCSQCKNGYGISLDLRRCVKKEDTCGAPGVIIFILTCKKPL